MRLKDFNNMTLGERQDFLRKRGIYVPTTEPEKTVNTGWVERKRGLIPKTKTDTIESNGFEYLNMKMIKQLKEKGWYVIIGSRGV